MALDKERLLELAYQLVREPGWPGGDQKPGGSAIGTVAEIFREFSRRPAKEDRLRQALSIIEKLPECPLARHSMRDQYRGIVQALGVHNGQVKHPVLKDLSFEELAYVIGWVARLHRAFAGPVTDLPEGVTPERDPWKDVPAGRQSRPETGSTGKSGKVSGRTSSGERNRRSDADDIDPRLAVLKNWTGFKDTKNEG
ncbi:hypothetical protein [Desulfofundulus thermosubterraneus]|uniref:Uncharacterized protein n=1 Tax=Desulfofundulus thermosubterraneus DSM 16057 TaxID=1121432 RepID=A0A1M6FF27_9FIRM|nr:hypothetical protein [Desulfofundulus thermosubterraneus]SHI96301.1 hypothetical protein SAMN02745219_01444 [Desulfofundulus thermosubterraneus DSM 16057]